MRTTLVAFAVAFAFAGCASAPGGGNQTVQVHSEPAGAACTVSRGGAVVGAVDPTPGQIVVGPSEKDLLVTCTKPGWQTGTGAVKAIYKGFGLGQLLTGGAAAVVEDAAKGTDFHYDDAGATVILPPS